jgi:Domain of unknown function (DUF5667)
MVDQSDDELLNDDELRNLIDQLRPVPERDPGAVKHGRMRYLSNVNTLLKPQVGQFLSDQTIHLPAFSVKTEKTKMNPQKRFVFSAIALIVVLVLILFGGAGVTAYAAQSALPGDALYPIKTGLEQSQVKLARDAGDQAQLHLAFAERRLQELSELINEGRFGEIDQVASEFEYHVQQAINAMQIVVAGDPVRANELAARIASTLSEFGRNLSAMMANVPDNLRPSMERAIQASHGGNVSPLDENSNLNENENNNDNINLNENENENENGNVNLNENYNENYNENENVNFNENENDDGEHDNANLNSNQNSNSNMNEDQGNHNSNDDEHNSNTNINNNQNTNDDHEENHNSNTNFNDNGEHNGGD